MALPEQPELSDLQLLDSFRHILIPNFTSVHSAHLVLLRIFISPAQAG
jgi:hypothetical protein